MKAIIYLVNAEIIGWVKQEKRRKAYNYNHQTQDEPES